MLSPNNDVVSAIATHTSGGSFTAANWNLSGTYAVLVAAPTGVAATDTANRDAALAALPAGGGEVRFRPGSYAFNTPLPNRSSITYRGAGGGVATQLTFSSSMLAPTADLADLHFSNLYLVGTSSSHLIELGTTGGLYLSRFLDCWVSVTNAAASIVHQNGTGDFDQTWWERCNLFRAGTATVAAFDITNPNGACNGNVWKSCRANSANATSTPFWLIHSTGASTYAYDNVWRDIIGEQNRGGMIHVYSGQNSVIDHVTDYDATGNYMLDFIRIDKDPTGSFPIGGRVTNCGPRGSAMQAGTYHLNVNSSTGDFYYAGIHNALQVSIVNVPTRGRTGISRAGGLNRGWITTTTSYTFTTADNVVYSNGPSLTHTLLDPTTVEVGAEFTVKNLHSTACTVVSAGASKTLDGAASQTLTQWGAATYKSDGTQWLMPGSGSASVPSAGLSLPSNSWISAGYTFSTAATGGIGTLRVAPVYIPRAGTLANIAAELTALSTEAGVLFRVGVYADRGDGVPGALVADAGTIPAGSADAIGQFTKSTGAVVITAGWYFVGGVIQVASASQPTLRVIASGTVVSDTAVASFKTAAALGYFVSSVTAGLPNPFSASTPGVTGNSIPRCAIQVT